ncbi:MAG: sensor histidine kinase, partial [Ruminococcus sp.]
ELAEECAGRLKSAAEKKNVHIKVKGSKIRINSVRQLVSEIVHNLIDNAVKYNTDGGSVTVTVGSDKRGDYIIVADTGIGIPKEYQQRIFERFYRVGKSRSKDTGGTGLGLAIVRHAAEDIGAELSLESAAGKGTVITVIFPSGKIE